MIAGNVSHKCERFVYGGGWSMRCGHGCDPGPYFTATPTPESKRAGRVRGMSELPIGVDTSETYEFDRWRNRIAGRLANAALRLATDDYRKFVGGAILYGMNAAARDVAEGSEPPVDWFKS